MSVFWLSAVRCACPNLTPILKIKFATLLSDTEGCFILWLLITSVNGKDQMVEKKLR